MSNVPNTIRPTPFQATVLSIPEDHFIFLGGGRGGGKSFGLQLLILRHCDQYKNRARVLVTRRRLKSLPPSKHRWKRLLLPSRPGRQRSLRWPR